MFYLVFGIAAVVFDSVPLAIIVAVCALTEVLAK